MRIDGKLRDEKLQQDINREAERISELSSGKIDKYKYLTGEEILTFDKKIYQNKLNLHILLFKNLLKNKQRRWNINAKTNKSN